MSIFDRLFGRTRKESLASMVASPSEKQTTVGRVSDCRLWKCPKCSELLEKSALGTIWIPFEPITKVAGIGTCSKCGAELPQSDIYGGLFDVKDTVTSGKLDEQPKLLSIVVFRIKSNQPPSDAKSYCRKVIAKKFPSANMESHYIVGFADDLSVGEAFALYQNFVRQGQLPDLGRQVDSLKGSVSGGDDIVALFFS